MDDRSSGLHVDRDEDTIEPPKTGRQSTLQKLAFAGGLAGGSGGSRIKKLSICKPCNENRNSSRTSRSSTCSWSNRTSVAERLQSKTRGITAALRWNRSLNKGTRKRNTMEASDNIWWEGFETTKIVRRLQEAVISVAISDDGTMCAAGTVGAKVLIFRASDNSEVASFQFKSGINSVVLCGSGEFCSIVVGTFAGFVNSYYSNAPLANGESPPPDDRQFPGVPFGKTQYVAWLSQVRGGLRLAAGGKGGLVTLYNVELLRGRACVLHEMLRFNAIGDVYGLAIDQTASVIATGGDQKIVQIWRITNPKNVPGIDVTAHVAASFLCKAQVHSLSLTADAAHLAVGTSDSVEIFKLWFKLRNGPEGDDESLSTRLGRPLRKPSRIQVITRCSSSEDILKPPLHTRMSRGALIVKRRSLAVLRRRRQGPKRTSSGGASAAEQELHKDTGLSVIVEPFLLLDEHAHQGGVAFARESGSILAIGGGFNVTVTSVETGGSLYTKHHSGRVRCVALSRAGDRLLVGGFDRTVSLHVVGGGATVREFSMDVKAESPAPSPRPPGQRESLVVRKVSNKRSGPEKECVPPAGRPSRPGRAIKQQTKSPARRTSTQQAQQTNSGVAPMVVRSVSLSGDGLRIALGADHSGAGLIKLYSTQPHMQEPLLITWKRAKAVWVVRLSSDGALLAAGGYDCQLTLYNVLASEKSGDARPPMLEVPFIATKGVAFIWSLNFSPCDSWLTVGCWNGDAVVYRVDRGTDLQGPLDVVLGTPEVGEESPATAESTGSPSGGRLAKRRLTNKPWQLSRGWRAALEIGRKVLRASTTRLAPAAKIHRSDRVYAVALDATGRHLVVGGRDKKVAMYDLRPREGMVKFAKSTANGSAQRTSNAVLPPLQQGCSSASSMRYSERYSGVSETEDAALEEDNPQLMWEAGSDDFVYSVCVSQNIDYCAFGGTARTLVVLNGKTGTKLFSVPFASTVWAVQITQVLGGEVLAVGGEFPTLSVISLATREVQLELPVDGEVQSICLTHSSICYNAGSSAFVYGAGGTACGWQDRPSFSMMTSLISSLAAEEHMLLRCVSVILMRHPSIVNTTADATCPDAGPSLVQWAIENGCSSSLLAKLLNAQCSLGLLRDSSGRTAISPAIEHGKSAHMQLLLEALVSGRFVALPGSMKAVASTFSQWCYRFPADFLNLIGSMPLQPEPEILGGRETQDVTLTRMLIRGSPYRCPTEFWDADLDAHSVRGFVERGQQLDKDGILMQDGFIRAAGGTGGIKALRVPFEGFAGSEDGSVSPLRLILDAVAITADYAVFGKVPLQVLLDYKWSAFGQRIYIRQCILKAIDLVVAIMYYSTAFYLPSLTYADMSSVNLRFTVLICLGWSWTTFMGFYRDIPSCLQALVFATSLQGRDEMDRVVKLIMAAASIVPLVTNALMLYARTRTGAIGDPDDVASGSSDDVLLMMGALRCLHGVAILYGCLLACFSFRGFLRFGSLVHMVFTVVQDIAPFLALTSIVLLGFSLALAIVTGDMDAPSFQQYGWLSAAATTVDMGLYATTIQPELMHQAMVFSFYFPFMLVVQVILLNLLVAIMSDSTQRNIRGAALVARYQRARLIVEIEPRKSVSLSNLEAAAKATGSKLMSLPLARFVVRFLAVLASAVKHVLEFGTTDENPRPVWLHVLAPSEGGAEEESTEQDVQKELAGIRRVLSALQERCDEMPAAVERQMRLAPTGGTAS